MLLSIKNVTELADCISAATTYLSVVEPFMSRVKKKHTDLKMDEIEKSLANVKMEEIIKEAVLEVTRTKQYKINNGDYTPFLENYKSDLVKSIIDKHGELKIYENDIVSILEKIDNYLFKNAMDNVDCVKILNTIITFQNRQEKNGIRKINTMGLVFLATIRNRDIYYVKVFGGVFEFENEFYYEQLSETEYKNEKKKYDTSYKESDDKRYEIGGFYGKVAYADF